MIETQQYFSDDRREQQHTIKPNEWAKERRRKKERNVFSKITIVTTILMYQYPLKSSLNGWVISQKSSNASFRSELSAPTLTCCNYMTKHKIEKYWNGACLNKYSGSISNADRCVWVIILLLLLLVFFLFLHHLAVWRREREIEMWRPP